MYAKQFLKKQTCTKTKVLMKTVLFSIVLPILLYSCSTTKISWDRFEDNNVRHIGTKSLETKIDNATYDFSLTVFKGSNYKDYCLLISSIWLIKENWVVLIKLGNDESIKLIANNVHQGKVDYPSYSPIVGAKTPSGVLTTQKVDYYSSIYSLDPEVLYKIEQYGIYKVRIQYGNSYKEKTWVSDKLGKYIKDSHSLLESQLEKEIAPPKSIEENF